MWDRDIRVSDNGEFYLSKVNLLFQKLSILKENKCVYKTHYNELKLILHYAAQKRV